MTHTIQEQINTFYLANGIHPSNFRCPNQNFCRQFAHSWGMIEAKMSMVGSSYSQKYPRIVVVSLDPPGQGELFFAPQRRTTEYIAKFTEAENYTYNRPNPHWAMTQIIVKDILCLFGYRSIPYAAVVSESYSDRPIDNVSKHFAHVNVAKCSMNNPGGGQAARAVHNVCSRSYLLKELTILQPMILVSQGKATNEILGNILIGRPVSEGEHPITFKVVIGGNNSLLWLPIRHPSRQQSKIRGEWLVYLRATREWANIKK